jgi:8-oxo-dGTP pyrophosphatase MutT (NUDIX family)
MSVEPWRRLSQEYVLQTPYVNLRAEKFRLPDGTVKDPYYVVERPDAVFVFPVTPEDEVVLVRQYRPAIDVVELGLPAGLLNPGEDPERAGRRELLEETGYGGGSWQHLIRLSSSPGLKDNWAHMYLARGVEETAEPTPDEHERLEVVRVPVGKVRDLALSGEIVSASGVAAALLALRELGSL